MAITINGTTGIAGVDGSASTPSYQGADTNTGIFFPAADTIAFGEGGAEVARFDSSGNLGIGSSPAAWGASGVVFKAVQLGTASSISGYSGGNDLWLNQNAYFDGSAWKYVTTNPAANYGISDNNHIWRTAASGTAGNTITFTERARITSDGNLWINQTTPIDTSNPERFGLRYTYPQTGMAMNNGSTTGTYAILFTNPNGIVGSIQTSASSTSYVTSSDYRLKENVAPMTSALATVSALKPVTYTWKADGSQGQGFIAHELQAIVPEAVTGEKDAVETYTDEDGNEQTRIKPQGIDTSFLVATLTAAIQELKAELDTTKARLAALEAK